MFLERGVLYPQVGRKPHSRLKELQTCYIFGKANNLGRRIGRILGEAPLRYCSVSLPARVSRTSGSMGLYVRLDAVAIVENGKEEWK